MVIDLETNIIRVNDARQSPINQIWLVTYLSNLGTQSSNQTIDFFYNQFYQSIGLKPLENRNGEYNTAYFQIIDPKLWVLATLKYGW